MELKVIGTEGQDAKFAVDVEPNASTTIIIGEGRQAIVIPETSDFFKIGVFPFQAKITFVFHTRPWSFMIQQESGQSFSTTSEAQNLRTTLILTPDIVSLSLNFSTNQ